MVTSWVRLGRLNVWNNSYALKNVYVNASTACGYFRHPLTGIGIGENTHGENIRT